MIDRDPLVTIVTPSFNQGRFIRETIESVLNQDYPRIEYLVLDAASTDETSTVVRPYLDRLTFISEPDRGQSHAINKGFARARGDIVAWLNSDDLFLPGAVRRAVEAFKANPAAGVVYGDGYQIDEAGVVTSIFPHTQHFDLWKLVFASDYVLQQSTFFRRSALGEVGPLREDLHYVMDWDILIRLGKRYGFAYVPELMGSLREYGTAKTFTGGAKRVAEIRKLLREHSGTMFPPGYIVYGLDTYHGIWMNALDRWPAALQPIARIARTLVTKVTHRIIGAASARGQAWFRDGWMAPRAWVMLPAGSGEIVMRGEVPGLPELKIQTVTVRSRGRVVAREHLRPGPFELRFAWDEPGEQCPLLHVESSYHFRFPAASGTSDSRTLSLRMDDIQWATKGGIV